MAKQAQKITLSPSRDIPFDRLRLSAANVRRVKPDEGIANLADDIARRGLLHNLNVRPILDPEGQETGDYEVPAGGRRYRALELLVKSRRLAKDAPIPCRVRAANDAILAEDDSLAENAQRVNLQERLLVTPLSRFRQGSPIKLAEGVLFTTYATLRSQARESKASRVDQIVEWLGADFDGVIIFDEAHAMANAAGGKGARGEQKPSQQGRAGLRLQHALPDARIVYVSATGATTVQNLAYAQRLGLWGGTDFPFASRSEFVAAIEDGGVAAMEVLARDLKALARWRGELGICPRLLRRMRYAGRMRQLEDQFVAGRLWLDRMDRSRHRLLRTGCNPDRNRR